MIIACIAVPILAPVWLLIEAISIHMWLMVYAFNEELHEDEKLHEEQSKKNKELFTDLASPAYTT